MVDSESVGIGGEVTPGLADLRVLRPTTVEDGLREEFEWLLEAKDDERLLSGRAR